MKTTVKSQWACQECGYKQLKWSGSCSSCHQWNTFVEEFLEDAKKKQRYSFKSDLAKPIKIADVSDLKMPRITTKGKELDRLFGGGIVQGSLTLIGGSPGIGKSTLMLQVSERLSKQGLTVLYICAEESVEQTCLRAKRLGVSSENLFLLNESNFDIIKAQIDQVKPDVVIADSIQILYNPEYPSSPGSVVQVREVTSELMHIAKKKKITTFLVGHVTKSGEIAGPRVLEHLVDTVLDFEGDRHHGFRLLRVNKNRFGSTDEIAIFQMKESGLKEITSPSEIFLSERIQNTPGSVIASAMEGNRSFLVEVQALVTTSAYASPSRKSTGLDQNRLALLLAVVEKRLGYQMHKCDVFVSLTGGLRILEPAIDLAVLLAIASSFSNRVLHPKTAVIGEVGLSGEVRSVSRIETRLKEVIQMGFSKCLIPKRNMQGLSKSLEGKIELIGLELVDEAISELLQNS